MNSRNILPRFLLLALLCISSTDSWSQSDSITIVIGNKVSLPSKALNEERTISIYTPQTYNQDSLRCPVLYLFDGQWHFRHVVSTVDYLSRRGKIPSMIVVAIPSTDRRTDFTPLRHSSDDQGQRDSNSLTTQRDYFFRFLQEELIPYKVATFNMLKRHYESLSTEFGYKIIPPQDVVELFGYALLSVRNKVDDAIAVFRENVENHPTSFSACQYLGEAYMMKGHKDLARENFEKSIALNPNNERGKEMLNRLRETEK